ncbi:MAG: hypothetical protein WAT64_02740, partial [Dokdonella sp.]
MASLAIITPALAAIPSSERQVLINLYNNTGGANWTNNTGWLGPGGTECIWVGVACDAAEAHVQNIELRQNNLTGSLPSLTGLTNLLYVFVESNQLTGQIPSLTGLITLKKFFASDNQLTGPIPSLAGLTNLDEFGVARNQLTGAIPSLTGLTSLY